MIRRLLLGTAIALLAVAPGYLRAQTPATMPMSGTVVDRTGAPLADAHVVLIRHTGRPPNSEGAEILAQAQTNAQGQFAFGDVALRAEVAFPVETAIWLDYAVAQQGLTRQVDTVQFTAPRTESRVRSVAAEIHVR